MITIPSIVVLLAAATTLVVLMICQWLISGDSVRNRRGHASQAGPANCSRTEFHQAA